MNVDIVLAIDPGTTESGWIVLRPDGSVEDCGTDNNNRIAKMFADWQGVFAIEWFESMGMNVGREVFETVCWIGRFQQIIGSGEVRRITRREVKLHLCGTMRAKDPNIRQALLDLYSDWPTLGGGKNPAIGISAKPGPLYGVSGHMWSALAVAVTYRAQLESSDGRNDTTRKD